jgi:hypothetical protein
MDDDIRTNALAVDREGWLFAGFDDGRVIR